MRCASTIHRAARSRGWPCVSPVNRRACGTVWPRWVCSCAESGAVADHHQAVFQFHLQLLQSLANHLLGDGDLVPLGIDDGATDLEGLRVLTARQRRSMSLVHDGLSLAWSSMAA